MKKSRLLVVGLSLVSLLCSCTPAWKHYEVNDYKMELPFVNKFLICQLSDLHFSTATNLEREFEYISKVINAYGVVNEINNPELAKPNLLILNGDTFMNSNKYIVRETFKFFDSLKIPYAFTYGNHDYQGNYSRDFIEKTILQCQKESGYAMFKNPTYDDVYGNSNYVIDLKLVDKLMYQIYLFDSNSYVFGAYDSIHEDQVDWYQRVLLQSNGYETMPSEINENTFAKSLAFFHIPTKEFKRAVDEFYKDEKRGEKISGDNFANALEGCNTEGGESSIMKKMHELKSTVGIGVAHDHGNSTDLWSYDGTSWPIRLVYGNKTGNNAYTYERNMGATFFTLNENVVNSENGNPLYFNVLKTLVNYDGEVTVQWQNK